MTHNPRFDSLVLRGDGPGMIGPLTAQLDLVTKLYTDMPVVAPGTSLGAFAVNDIANRLLARGATPRYLTATFKLSDSLPEQRLRYVARQTAAAAVQAEAEFTSVDTVFTDWGPRFGMTVSMTGLGEMRPDTEWGPERVSPGDVVIMTGQAGAHGVAMIEGADNSLFLPPVLSDSASLGDVVHSLQNTVAQNIRMMYYPAEGVNQAVAEIQRLTGLTVDLDADAVPVAPIVADAARCISRSVLDLQTAAAMLVIVPERFAAEALAAIRRSAHGSAAAPIARLR